MDPSYAPVYSPMVPVFFSIFFVVLAVALAIGNGFIARALGKSVVLWVILSLIPVVNVFFYYYIGYAVVLGILHRLNAITARSGVVIDT